jgi:putative acetyltransferase
MPEGKIDVDDPTRPDVRELLTRHLVFADSQTPRENVHALDVDGLLDPAVTFFSYRADDVVLGVGALRRLDASHAEVKSMHVAQAARGRGIGRALLDHLFGVARDRGFRRVSLETGTGPAFESAQSLYKGAGFTPCEPFGGYRPSPFNYFMTLTLPPDRAMT